MIEILSRFWVCGYETMGLWQPDGTDVLLQGKNASLKD
jgi:hypothetical protein